MAEFISLKLQNDQSVLLTPFKTLERLVKYYPMWVSKSHSNHLNRFMIFIILFATIFYVSYQTILIFDDESYTNAENVLFIICTELKWYSFVLSRLFSVYYFYFQFNYPWKSNELSIPTNNVNKVKEYYHRVLVMVALMIIDGIVGAVVYYYTETKFYFIMTLIGTIFIYTPLYITFCVAAAIFLYYYCILCQLSQEMKQTDGTDFIRMFSKYKEIATSLQRHYHYSLKWCIYCRLCGILLHLWIVLYDITTKSEKSIDYVAFIVYLISFVVFVFPASLMNQQFSQYHLLLFHYGENYMDQASNINFNHQYINYNYLLQFATKYPLQIKIGSITVTNTNFAKFCVGFIVTKLISYTIRLLYVY